MNRIVVSARATAGVQATARDRRASVMAKDHKEIAIEYCVA